MPFLNHLIRHRSVVATAASVLGVLLLLGAKTVTSDPAAGAGATVSLTASDQGSVSGPVVNTQYGPVQVQATVAGGRVTDLQAVQLPAGGRSGDISSYAAPILRREALAAQGAGIQAVSGATYTSAGYSQSLQAALDQIAGEATSTTAADSSGQGGAA